jgi:hexosaminidase
MFPKSALVVFATLLTVFAPADALWPQPRTLQTGSTPLRLSGSFDITISGSIHNAPADLHAAVLDAKNHIKNDKLERLVVGRGAADAAVVKKAHTLSKLTLSLGTGATAHTITSEAQKAPEQRDEAYTLTVPGDGSGATLTANSTLGLFRGLTTFTQLFYDSDGTTYLLNAPIHIEDSPAYVSEQHLVFSLFF